MTNGRRVSRAPTAAELVKAIRSDGGRLFRTREPGGVFVLTTDAKLSARLQRLGGSPHVPPGMPMQALAEMDASMPPGAYQKARNGGVEWDIVLNGIALEGPETLWEAAGKASAGTVEKPQAKFNLPIEHWSPSSLSMLRRCPRQWQERYVKGRKERPAEAPVVGTTVHAGLERNFRQKIESHEDIPVAELVEWYDDQGFAETVEAEQERRGFEVYWDTVGKDGKPDLDSIRARGRKMLGAYSNKVSPRIQPSAVESFVSVDFGISVPVEGRADLIREAEPIIDWKTGKRARKKPQESWRIQGAVYQEAVGRPIEFHSVTATESGSVSIWTPLEAPELLVEPTPSERAEMRRTLATIEAEACLYMQLYGPDEPWPTHGRWHEFACNYCGFRSGCPAWSEE